MIKYHILKTADIYQSEKLFNELYKLTLSDVDSWMKAVLYHKKEAHVIVAIYNEKICGWAMFHRYQDPRCDERTHLLNIFVHYDYRRKGIGTGLVKRAQKFASQHNISLVSCPWDDRSHRFYNNNVVNRYLDNTVHEPFFEGASLWI